MIPDLDQGCETVAVPVWKRCLCNVTSAVLNRVRQLVIALPIFLTVLLLNGLPHTAHAEPAWLLNIDGAIGPATADYFQTRMHEAADAAVPLVVLQMDTPGGLDSAMRDIISTILDAPIPVACLVAPAGARAASAGTYILYACHVSAMAGTTHLGAATPVAIRSPAMPGNEQPDGQDKTTAMERKTLNDAIAYIRSLAEQRGRNAEWAEKAVRDAATLTAHEALDKKVIDLVVETPAELLKAIDGRKVDLHSGPHVLTTSNLSIVAKPPGWRHRFLATITDPNVAYILMLIGIYGLLLEFYNPGGLVPGIIGAICLLIALYAFQIMPISYVGLGLIILGVALLSAEAAMPSFGVLGIGGVIAFMVGSIMLMDRNIPGYRIALPLILALVAASTAAVLVMIAMALRARQQPASGSSILLGATVVAVEDFEHEGWVRLQGERWRARSDQPVHRGETLTVTAVNGLTVDVSRTPSNVPH